MNIRTTLHASLLVGLIALTGCASPTSAPDATGGDPSDGEAGGVSVETVRDAADLHVTVFRSGKAVAMLDYSEQAHEARWAAGERAKSAPMHLASLEEQDAGDLARALWTATRRVESYTSTLSSVRPREIDYTRKPQSCTPISFCESFMGGWACVSLDSYCNGQTWIVL